MCRYETFVTRFIAHIYCLHCCVSQSFAYVHVLHVRSVSDVRWQRSTCLCVNLITVSSIVFREKKWWNGVQCMHDVSESASIKIFCRQQLANRGCCRWFTAYSSQCRIRIKSPFTFYRFINGNLSSSSCNWNESEIVVEFSTDYYYYYILFLFFLIYALDT